MKKYELPKIMIVDIENVDVITTSFTGKVETNIYEENGTNWDTTPVDL